MPAQQQALPLAVIVQTGIEQNKYNKEEFEPANMPYQNRQLEIIDPCGNYWWIPKRQVKKGYTNKNNYNLKTKKWIAKHSY